jgi:hypothetical protein
LQQAGLVLLVTDPTACACVYSWIASRARLIVDTRNACNRSEEITFLSGLNRVRVSSGGTALEAAGKFNKSL